MPPQPNIDSVLTEKRVFEPSAEFRSQAHIRSLAEYERLYREAEQNPSQFWGDIASELHWFKPWDQVLEWNCPWAKWFAGGQINLSYNCLDRHVLLSESRRADPTRLGPQVLRHQLPLCPNPSSQGQNRARTPILAGAAPGLFRQRTHYRDRNRQPPHRRFATPSQRPRNPPRTAHDPGTSLGTRQEGKALRPAPHPALPLVALCLESPHSPQGRLRRPRAYRHSAPARRTSPGLQDSPLPPSAGETPNNRMREQPTNAVVSPPQGDRKGAITK